MLPSLFRFRQELPCRIRVFKSLYFSAWSVFLHALLWIRAGRSLCEKILPVFGSHLVYLKHLHVLVSAFPLPLPVSPNSPHQPYDILGPTLPTAFALTLNGLDTDLAIDLAPPSMHFLLP